MVARLPDGYVFDPVDPRAPTHEQWERMSPEERQRVVDMLPTSLPIELAPPEGDFDIKVICGLVSSPEDEALIGWLYNALSEALLSKEEAERRVQEEAERTAQLEKERAEEAERTAQLEKELAEAQAGAERAAQLEKELAEAKAEIERLRGGSS